MKNIFIVQPSQIMGFPPFLKPRRAKRLGVAGSQGAKGQPGNRWWANHVENKALEEECRGGTTDR